MSDLTPRARVEHFLARIAGLPAKILSPKTRIEMFLQRIIDNGGTGPGGEVTPASIVTATGQMTEAQAAATRRNLGAGSANPPDVVDIISATPTIEPEDNTIYKCGELTSLTITNPPAQGAYSIIFTSGATATDLSISPSIKMPDGFSVEANTRYEINVLDGYAVVGIWEVSE